MPTPEHKAQVASARHYSRKASGLCVDCGREKNSGISRCPDCSERSKAHNRAIVARRRAAGVCITCGKPSEKRRCNSCNEGLQRSAKRLRLQRIADGVCVTCGANPVSQHQKCADCKKKHNALAGDLYRRVKIEAMQAYGGTVCACCGESNVKFLTIDHIFGGGTAQRKQLKGVCSIYRWLKRNNYPSGYQVLCYNCNCARAYNNGICPHKEHAAVSTAGSN